MTTHSKLSPSARHRWGVCPASVREEAKYPERPSGPAAIDGTHTHSLLEWCLGRKGSAYDMVGKTMNDHDGSFVVDAERAERVQFALDYIDGLVAATSSSVEVISERRVHPDALVGRNDMSGTVDVQVISYE